MSDKPSSKVKKLEDISKVVKVCRDFYEGAISVINREYLPVWQDESEAHYNIRIASTAFPNMYAPIVAGLTGLITKKEPVVTGFDDFDAKDVDLRGTGLTSFIKKVCESSIVSGVEFVAVESSVSNNKVYFKRYSYESLMSYQVQDGKVVQMVFREVLEKASDKFGIEEVERYIVFKVGGGEVWYDDGKGSGLKKQSEWVNSLSEIPVVGVVTGKELSRFEVVPRLYDIAMLNKVMLNLESQLANVLSVVGNPVPVFYGEYDDDGVTIGVKDALVFEDKQKQGFDYVEISGGGVSKLQDKLKSVGQAIDNLSFSMLEKSGNRTVIDAQESQSKSTSFLTDVAVELETKFNRLMYWKYELDNKTVPKDSGLEFKKDFDDVLFSEAQLKLLHELVGSGDLSRETFWDKLKVANILPKDFDASEEKERLETEPA